MSLTPKNWKEFQHYSDRKPSWIKLHKGLLDDFAFSRLPIASRALAPMLWLLASEYSNGEIAASNSEIAFRLHMSEQELVDAIKPLINAGFFIDSGPLADSYQNACLEKEIQEQKQVETEEESRAVAIATTHDVSRETLTDDWPADYEQKFWAAYPRRIGRKSAFLKLKTIRKSGEVTFAQLMAAVANIPLREPKFIPHPTTWLNRGGWDDEPERNTNGQVTSPILNALDDNRERIAALGLRHRTGADNARLLPKGGGERPADVLDGGISPARAVQPVCHRAGNAPADGNAQPNRLHADAEGTESGLRAGSAARTQDQQHAATEAAPEIQRH